MMKLSMIVSLLVVVFGTASAHAADSATDAATALQTTIVELDRQAFDAFNHCADPLQLKKHAAFFDPAVEFYHDQGGVTWTRDAMLANTQKYVCGHFRREVVPGSQKVYPVKGFGAIELGSHTFCQFSSNKCEGIADFVIVWKQNGDGWSITRVLSFGHRENR